jgi:hypothetical protein
VLVPSLLGGGSVLGGEGGLQGQVGGLGSLSSGGGVGGEGQLGGEVGIVSHVGASFLISSFRFIAAPRGAILPPALPGQHVFHYGDVGRDVQGLVAEKRVQLPVEGGGDGVHHSLNFAHGAVNIGARDSCSVHAVIGVEELQRGGQVVVQKLADLGQLPGVLHHVGDDFGGDGLHVVDLGRDLGVLDAVVEPMHLGQGQVPLPDQFVQLGAAVVAGSRSGSGSGTVKVLSGRAFEPPDKRRWTVRRPQGSG